MIDLISYVLESFILDVELLITQLDKSYNS